MAHKPIDCPHCGRTMGLKPGEWKYSKAVVCRHCEEEIDLDAVRSASNKRKMTYLVGGVFFAAAVMLISFVFFPCKSVTDNCSCTMECSAVSDSMRTTCAQFCGSYTGQGGSCVGVLGLCFRVGGERYSPPKVKF